MRGRTITSPSPSILAKSSLAFGRLLRIQELQHRMIDRERRLAQIQGVGQTLVTLSHHINNATQSISGMAQLARDAKEEDIDLYRKMVDVCIKQTERIGVVLGESARDGGGHEPEDGRLCGDPGCYA